MSTARVTITLPEDVVRDIDRVEKNRSRFVLRALRSELERVRQEELRKSLSNPHAESLPLAEAGVADWSRQGPGSKSDAALLDPKGGTPVEWINGKGWRAKTR